MVSQNSWTALRQLLINCLSISTSFLQNHKNQTFDVMYVHTYFSFQCKAYLYHASNGSDNSDDSNVRNGCKHAVAFLDLEMVLFKHFAR